MSTGHKLLQQKLSGRQAGCSCLVKQLFRSAEEWSQADSPKETEGADQGFLCSKGTDKRRVKVMFLVRRNVSGIP